MSPRTGADSNKGPDTAQDRRHYSHKGPDTAQGRCHNPGTAEGRRKAVARASCRQPSVEASGLGNQYTSNEEDFSHDTEGEVDADKDRCSVDQELEGPDARSDSPGVEALLKGSQLVRSTIGGLLQCSRRG